MLKEHTDEELMLAYQLGDEAAFRELYSRHSGKVLNYLRSKVRNEAKALDIFQAAFLKLHKFRARYNPTLPFAPWLFTICRSELLDQIKTDRRRQLELMVAEVPDAPFAHELQSQEIEIDIKQLSSEQRQAIELRFHRNFSFEDIAQALETSPSNARQIVSRAVRSLKGIYGKK